MWDTLASDQTLRETARALRGHGFDVLMCDHAQEAKERALALLPEGASVFTVTSRTSEQIGLLHDINESGRYRSIRKTLLTMDRATQRKEMTRVAVSPDWVVGSVHAVTRDGQVMIASATGSQLGPYVYGADHVLWIAGTQKIVPSVEEGFRRIEEYVFPLENERAQKAYGKGSAINDILIVRQQQPGRVTILFVREKLGF
ncbi:lactate utilization protein [Patescibacteria group bacterium]|nr:lactate utilization protein [Patescibacteria group bacterium]